MSDARYVNTKSTNRVERLDGDLHVVHALTDEEGNVVQHIFTPLMVELRLQDVIQIVIGSTLLCIPVAYTEEVWTLGASLPLINAIYIVFLSLLFLGLFGYSPFQAFVPWPMRSFGPGCWGS